MSGELNGTKALILKGDSEIVGQGEATLTFNGTPIETTNKSHDDWVTYLDGELSGKGFAISLTCTYNSDTVFRAVRAASLTGTQDTYKVVFGSTGEQFSGSFVPTGLSDALPMGDKVTTSLTLNSSGPVVHTPAT